jgi:GAF domain-containing protein
MPLDAETLLTAQQAARAAESAERWWRQLEAAAGAAVTSEALDNLLAGALDAMREVLGCDEVSLLIADETGSELIARASVGLGELAPSELHIPAGAGMAGRVLALRHPVLFPDLRTTQLVSPTLRQRGMLSVVAVPVMFEDRVLGVMHAGSTNLAAFGEADAELLLVLADRLAVALERVRLFEHERELRLAAEELADRLARIQGVTSELVAAASNEDVAAAIATNLGGESAAGGAAVGARAKRSAELWLVDEEALVAVRPATARAGGAAAGRIPLGGDDLLARAVAERRLLHEPAGAGARTAVPVVLRGEPIGALAIESGRGSPSDAERSFLGVVAEQVAQGLERVRLFAEQAQLSTVSSFFARAARVTAEATGLEETLERLASLALAVLGDICLIDVAEHDRITRMVAQHRDPARQHLVDRLRNEFAPDPAGRHPAVEVIRRREARFSADLSDEFMSATTRDAEHLTLTRQLGFRSYLSVPLVASGEAIGAVTIVYTDRPFQVADVEFAERLAQQVAAVVANARRYDATFRTSHLLQQSLLPKALPEVSGLEVDTRYLAASRGLDVGGDFYDLIVLPSGRVGLMIGDVAGHDGDAAAMMGHLRSAIRALAGQVRRPAELVAALQWSWQLLGFTRIATGVFGRLDQDDGSLTLASAGHYPPLLVSDEATRFLPVLPGPPLGAVTSAVRPPTGPEWQGVLAPGELLLCYTDGAIDERGAGIDASMARLAQVARDGPRDPAAVCERVIDTLAADRADDVALLAIRRSMPVSSGRGGARPRG